MTTARARVVAAVVAALAIAGGVAAVVHHRHRRHLLIGARDGGAPAPADLAPVREHALALDGTVRADGKAAADVELTLAGPGGIRRGRSGPDGAFAFDGVAAGRYALRAISGERAAYVAAIDVGGDAGMPMITVALVPGVRVAGKLRGKDGAPIAGGEVTLAEADGTPLPRAIATGADGSFAFAAVLPGAFVVAARAVGFYPSPPKTIDVQHRALTLELRLDPGAVVSGRVVDERAQPVAGARVEVAGESPDGTPVAVTMLGAATGIDASRVEPSGELGVLRGPIPYPPAVPAPVAATNGAATANGAPANGAATNGAAANGAAANGGATANGVGNGAIITDAHGGFRVAGLPAGAFVVVATHPDFARGASAPLHVAAGGSVSVDVVLARGVAIAGRVADEEGRPLAGVELLGDDGVTSVVTGARGEFELAHVAKPLVVTARLAGYVSQKRALAPSDTSAVELRLARAQARLGGDVVDDRGNPVAGARLEISAAGMPPRIVTSDKSGRFAADKLAPGPYRVAVTHADFAAATVEDLAAGDAARVHLLPGGGIDGDVRDARSGAAPMGAQLTLTAGEKPRSIPVVNGHFSLTSLPPGRATLTASAPGYVTATRALDIPAGERLHDVTLRDLRVELERGGVVSGRVRDDRGDPAAGVKVVVTVGESAPLDARSDRDGRFRIDGVPAGHARIAATRDDGSAADEADVRPGDESRVDLTLAR